MQGRGREDSAILPALELTSHRGSSWEAAFRSAIYSTNRSKSPPPRSQAVTIEVIPPDSATHPLGIPLGVPS